MKTNKSEMIRDAIRAAGEPVTREYLASVTGIPRYYLDPLLSQLIRTNEVFVAGTAAVKRRPGGRHHRCQKTYELTEFAGEC
ncbi:MAG: hypothetical protein E6Q97_29370 [Desulfurellales bacterium]|nr:MAG: hypothetical protein E6Q97_29370 [Desulfurellales bacterium]